jgi:DNA-binding MltR family transcriptional regulator
MAERKGDVTLEELAVAVAKTSKRTHSGAVIALSAVLDNRLELVLKKAFVPMSKSMHDKLFESYRPLNSFAAKIILAFAVGAIVLDTYEELEKIRDIRNEFAHSAELLDFESPKIAALLAKFKKKRLPTDQPLDHFLATFNAVRDTLHKNLSSTPPSPVTETPAS